MKVVLNVLPKALIPNKLSTYLYSISKIFNNVKELFMFDNCGHKLMNNPRFPCDPKLFSYCYPDYDSEFGCILPCYRQYKKKYRPGNDQCLKNIETVQDVMNIIYKITEEGFNTPERLTDRISYLYRLNPPGHDELAKLSLMHSSVLGTAGIEEYAVTTVWMCAMQAIIQEKVATVHVSVILFVTCGAPKCRFFIHRS